MATRPVVQTSAGVNQAQAAAQAAALAQAQHKQNRQFMALSMRKKALAQQANGGANSQNFVAGQALTYAIPTATNGYLVGFWVNCQLVNTLAAGSSAVYALNAEAPLTLIDTITVLIGGVQHNFRPYKLRHYYLMLKYLNMGAIRSPLAGVTNATMQAYYGSTSFPVAVGANTWNFRFFVPMNLLHPLDVRGIVPIQAGDTPVQVVINCAGSPYGADPILGTVVTTSGSGGASTVTGTIAVEAVYKDGQSYTSDSVFQPNLSGVETVQFVKDTPLQNLGSGQIFTSGVSYKHKIAFLWADVIDGLQSSKFASTSNLQIIQTAADQAGNRPFLKWGTNTNLDVRSYFDDLAWELGQDLPEGVIPLAYGPVFEQNTAGILEGKAFLDCTQQTGWPDFHLGIQLGSVGSIGTTGIAPRVEIHEIILNDPLVQV